VMNMTPDDLRTEALTCKSSGTQTENGEAWIERIQVLSVKETTSKAHMQVHTNKESREKQPRRKLGPNRAERGMGRSAQPTPGLVWHSFALGVRLFTARKPPPQDEGESGMSSSQGSMLSEGMKQVEDSKPLA
jgi:hypothetical protein